MSGDPAGEEVFPFPDIDDDARASLGAVLAEAGVPHRWDGATLVVPADAAEVAGELILDWEAARRRGFPVGEETVVYGVAGWSDAELEPLVRELERRGIPYGWDGTGDLVVPASAEDAVDAIVGSLPDPAPRSLPEIDDCVLYDVDDLGDDRLDQLESELRGAGLPYAWDPDGALVVAAADAAVVERIIERVEHPLALEADTGGDDGDMAATEALGRLFVVADRLRRRPLDTDASMELAELATSLGALTAPFGVDVAVWDTLVSAATALAEAVAGRADPEVIAADAADLRDRLRPLV